MKPNRLHAPMLITVIVTFAVLSILSYVAFNYGKTHGYIEVVPTGKGKFLGLKAENFFTDQISLEICKSISSNDIDRLKTLLDQCPDVNVKGKKNVTFLLFALCKENEKAFRLLLEKGADPAIRSTGTIYFEGNRDPYRRITSGDTVTYLAAIWYRPIYLQLILRNNGDPNLIDPRSKLTPVYYTSGRHTNQDNFRVAEDRKTKLEALIAAGADIEYRIPGQDNLLLRTTYQPSILILLQNGADFRVLNSDGEDFVLLLAGRLLKEPENRDLRKWLDENGYDIEAAKKAVATLEKPITLPFEERPWLPKRLPEE